PPPPPPSSPLSLHDALPIFNEGTTDYDDNIIFGLYMDSGVGGSQRSCDDVYESDDDNAYWDKSYPGLNLVYTWDVYGHGVDLSRSEEHTSELQSRFDLVCRL